MRSPNVVPFRGSARARVPVHLLGAILGLAVVLLPLGCAQAPPLDTDTAAPADANGTKEPGKVRKPPGRGKRPIKVPKGIIPGVGTDEEKKDGKEGEDGAGEGTGLLGGSAAEVLKLQSLVADLQGQIGDLKNFENSTRSALEGLENSTDELGKQVQAGQKQVEDAKKLVEGNRDLLTDLKKVQEGAQNQLNILDQNQDATQEALLEVQEQVKGLSTDTEGLAVDMQKVRSNKAEEGHHHEDALTKNDFMKWKGDAEQYVPGQAQWWYLAVSFLVSLIVAAVVFYLALKAIRPAYQGLNDLRAKVGTMANRMREGEEGPPGGPAGGDFPPGGEVGI